MIYLHNSMKKKKINMDLQFDLIHCVFFYYFCQKILQEKEK